MKTTCYLSSCVGTGHSDGFYYPGLFIFRIFKDGNSASSGDRGMSSSSSLSLSVLMNRVRPMNRDVSIFVKHLLELGMTAIDVTKLVTAYTTESYMAMRERYDMLLYKDILRV